MLGENLSRVKFQEFVNYKIEELAAATGNFVVTWLLNMQWKGFFRKNYVFSFGILLLEIISGRQNTIFHEEDQCLSLLGLAWKLWNEDNVLALVDPNIPVTCFEVELLRCRNVGLLCTQERAKDRLSISTVISMINSEIADLPRPKQPAFTARKLTRHRFLWTKPKDMLDQ
ncbi:G-type lectin S-receptor-like serine/threonine-protein kinase SD1-13 [Syzygium oleosum]|uniref:G-type lectin S-receptor-like serine/threonine-protein kinase SD1-13 n=1 Tax=Syzygium oleosum TaxID=219896 RepID=UPI0024BA297B|nr:G-type lectin S-receptor-like serine/threonine-protein kinase SD1-13 [Syzygium oleosum]